MKKFFANKIVRIAVILLVPVLVFTATVVAVKAVQSRDSRQTEASDPQEAYTIVSESDSSSGDSSSEKDSTDTSDLSSSDPNSDTSSKDPAPERSGDSSADSSESSEESSSESSESTDDDPEESSSDSEYSEDSSEESSGSESSEETSEESSEEPDPVYQTPYLVRVICASNVVTIFTYDDNGEYTIPVKAMICSTGPATPQGTFIMGYQARWNGLIEDQWGQYVSHITGDFLFHTVPSLTQSESTVQVDAYNALGTSASHGCVRLTAGDCYWMYCNCTAYETIIEIGFFDSDPLGKPASIMLPTDTSTNWDPTDPSSDNPWNDKGPHFEGIPESITVTAGLVSLDLSTGVTAYDTCGNPSEYFTVDTNADTTVPGTYSATYSYTDALGRSCSAETVIYVVPAETSEESESSETSDSSVPDGSTPEGSTPDGSTPDGSTPDGSVPDGSTPEGSEESRS